MGVDTVDLPCGCQVEASYDWVNGTVEVEITNICDPHWQKKRIYEVANLPLEEDPNSVINFVQWWRKVWASWQMRTELLEALEFAQEPLRNYFDAMAKQLELRKLIKDNPFPEYSIVQLDITKKAISLIETAIAKAKGE